MKKILLLFIAILAFAGTAGATTPAAKSSDDDMLAMFSAMDPDTRITALVELMSAELAKDSSSGLSNIWADKERKTVAFGIPMDDDTVAAATMAPTMFKELMGKEVLGDPEMAEFMQIIGGAGYGIDMNLTNGKQGAAEKKAIINFTAAELLKAAKK